MATYPQTVNGIFMRAHDERADVPAFFVKADGQWIPTTNRQSQEITEELGLGLAALGVVKGDAVAILMGTRPEWIQADAATLSLGGVTVGLYPTTTGEGLAYIVRHSESRVLIAENSAMLEPLIPHLNDASDLQTIVMLEGAAPDGLAARTLTWNQLRELGRPTREADPAAYRRNATAIEPEDVATLIYTSGTTGVPKGVILTHANFYQMVQAVQRAMPIETGKVGIAFLPFAHSFQRFIAYQGTTFGTQAYFAPSIAEVPQSLIEVRPEIFGAVPRILEKMYTRVHAKVAQGSPLKQRLFKAALKVGQERARYLQAQLPVPWWVQKKFALADRVVFSKIKAVLGGRVDRVVSGGAPLAPHIAEFFLAIGLLVLEGYGLTETSAATTVNLPEAFKFGTVGRPLPGAQASIAEDGEILLRGPGIFRGYFKDPAATAEAFTQDGWFRTGDIGQIDTDGFLRVTDRKKQIIVTAGGKNIAPQPIENKIKGIRWVSNALVHGDKRKFLTALITLDVEELQDHWLQQGLTPPARWAGDDKVRGLIQAELDVINDELASYERLKDFAILSADFSPQTGELTPTLKLKRKVIEDRNRAALDALYPND